MTAEIRRDPWRTIWEIAISDYLLAALLLIIAAALITTTWLRQTDQTNPIAYAQWLSETQARFGSATETMQALGLFSITRSWGFRALLALLASILLLRLIESGDRLVHLIRNRSWRWASLFPGLIYGGGLLLSIGLLITHLWGWREEMIIGSGERTTLSETWAWVELDDSGLTTTHSRGLVTYVQERLPGLQTRADGPTGQALMLQQTTDAEPVSQLTLSLTEERSFAIPEASLGIRLAARPNGATAAQCCPVLVQVYHSPSGRVAAQTLVKAGEEIELSVDDALLHLSHRPYAQLIAVFNPGLGPASGGLVLVVVGLLGNIARPYYQRRPIEGKKGDDDNQVNDAGAPPEPETAEGVAWKSS